MTEQLFPITPPPELVGRWLCSEDYFSDGPTNSTMTITSSRLQNVATQASRWGADQELEACVNWSIENQHPRWARAVRAARRPKSPSLKEQALAKLAAMERLWEATGNTPSDIVRRALEQLND